MLVMNLAEDNNITRCLRLRTPEQSASILTDAIPIPRWGEFPAAREMDQAVDWLGQSDSRFICSVGAPLVRGHVYH